jgi:hypothetical protein
VRDVLVEELSRDFGGHAYAKWHGAFWRLISLVDLGVEPGHPGALAAAEKTLDWVASPARLREIHERRIDGRVRHHASQDGQALRCAVHVGLRDDPRVDTVAEVLVETQWPDGGWNCDRHPHCVHSSFNETWGPILGLAAYGADDAVARGAEFLLEHRLVFSHRTGEPAHPAFFRLRVPAYWHYDVLAGLRTLQAAGAISDPRAADALDVLESKRRPDGTWRAEGKWWKRPGSRGSNIEAVDWGTRSNELLTAQAEGVLRAAGRL